MMDDRKLDAYFRRLAVPRPYTADAVSLHVLHRAHQMTVPFENLSIHLSERVSLAEDDLIHKIVNRRRGGFCYELNGAFAFVLQAMGVEVKRVAARVYGDHGRMGPPFAHMALVVRASDASGPWLIDVGFGSHSVYPLLFDSRHRQDDPAGSFLLVDTEDGDVDVLKDGEPQYRIEPRERSLADFIPACWWQQTSPDSHFTRSIICSRLTKDGRVSISGATLISTESGSRTEQQLPDDDAVLTAYREHFGIVLDKVPRAPRAPGAPPPAPRPALYPTAPGTSTGAGPGTSTAPDTSTAPGTLPSQAAPAAPFVQGSPLPGPPIQAYPSAGRSWTTPAAQAAPLAESGVTGPAERGHWPGASGCRSSQGRSVRPSPQVRIPGR
jgi:arylamine N-acetyltransferase